LIGTGPRAPKRGVPYTFLTTEQSLAAFDLDSLRDLPDREQVEDAGMASDGVTSQTAVGEETESQAVAS